MVASPIPDIQITTEDPKYSVIKQKLLKETYKPEHLLPTKSKTSAETKLLVNFICYR